MYIKLFVLKKIQITKNLYLWYINYNIKSDSKKINNSNDYIFVKLYSKTEPTAANLI